MKRVLIAAPISGSKQYSINEWFKWIANQTYSEFDFALCVNGDDQEELIEKLNQVVIHDCEGVEKRPIVLRNIEKAEANILQRITYARETLRRYATNNEYDYLFFLDTDTIPHNLDAIEKLIAHDKSFISGLYCYKQTRVPVAVDRSTGTNYSLLACTMAVTANELLEPIIVGLGCALIRHDVFNRFEFDYALFGKERGDDYGYCFALEQANVTRYLDPRILCAHLGKGIESPIRM